MPRGANSIQQSSRMFGGLTLTVTILSTLLAVLANYFSLTQAVFPTWSVLLIASSTAAILGILLAAIRIMRLRTSPTLKLVAAKILREFAYDANTLPYAEQIGVLRRLSESAFSASDILNEASPQKTFVVGPPGSGKTTLLRTLAWRASTMLVDGNRGVARLPVFLSAAKWKGEGINEWIESELGTRYSVPAPAAHEWSRAGKLLILLDGLDEAYNTERLARYVKRWASAYPDCHVVVSTRSVEELRRTPLLVEARTITMSAQTDRGSSLRARNDVFEIPSAALKVLILAALEPSRSYQMSEISGLTLLPPELLAPVLDELTRNGSLEQSRGEKARSYFRKPASSSSVVAS